MTIQFLILVDKIKNQTHKKYKIISVIHVKTNIRITKMLNIVIFVLYLAVRNAD